MAEKPTEQDAKVVLTESLWNDPELRPELEQMVVKKYPKAADAIPGYVARRETSRIVEQAEAINAKTEARILEQEQREALREKRKEIMEDPVLQIREEEIPEVERLMVDETLGPIGSHKAAAQLLRHQQAQVASNKSGSWSSMQVPGVGGAGGSEYAWLAPGVGNPARLDQVTRDRTHEILNDFAGGRGKKWL